jgi:hypothetical protein
MTISWENNIFMLGCFDGGAIPWVSPAVPWQEMYFRLEE